MSGIYREVSPMRAHRKRGEVFSVDTRKVAGPVMPAASGEELPLRMHLHVQERWLKVNGDRHGMNFTGHP